MLHCTADPFDDKPNTLGLPIGVPGLASATTSNFCTPDGKLGLILLTEDFLGRSL